MVLASLGIIGTVGRQSVYGTWLTRQLGKPRTLCSHSLALGRGGRYQCCEQLTADLQHVKDLQHRKNVMPHNQQWGQLSTDPGGIW